EKAVVVDDDVTTEMNLVRMAQHNVLPEDDVAATRSQQPRVQGLAEHETEGSGHGLRRGHNQLVLEQGGEARAPNDKDGGLCPRGLPGLDDLLLRLANGAAVRAIHDHDTSRVSA